MVREGYRVWFGKCNDFNLHGVFSRDRLDSDSGLWIWLSWFESRPPSQSFSPCRRRTCRFPPIPISLLRKNSMDDIDPSFERSAFAVCTLVFHSSGPRREVASSSTPRLARALDSNGARVLTWNRNAFWKSTFGRIHRGCAGSVCRGLLRHDNA